MRRTRRSVKDSCDRLWAELIRRSGVCERCGFSPERPRGFHAHHVYGRSIHATRWDLRNGMAVCATCHRWAEQQPLEFARWFNEHRPDDAVYLAAESRRAPPRRSLSDYLELETKLTTLLSSSTTSLTGATTRTRDTRRPAAASSESGV